MPAEVGGGSRLKLVCEVVAALCCDCEGAWCDVTAVAGMLAIAGESSGTCDSKPDPVDAVDAGGVPCVKLVKCGISMGDNRPGSDAAVSGKLPDPATVFSTLQSPKTNERSKEPFVRENRAAQTLSSLRLENDKQKVFLVKETVQHIARHSIPFAFLRWLHLAWRGVAN